MRHRVTLAVLLVTGGCVHHPADPRPRPALPLPEELAQVFEYPRTPLALHPFEEPGAPAVLERNSWIRRVHAFPALPAGGPVDELVIEHYVPREPPPAPAPAIFVPEFLAGRMPSWVARIFTDQGWQVLVLRWPVDMITPEKGAQELDATFHALLVNARRALDWLCEQPGVDPDRIGSFGVSFGGIFTVVLAAIDRDEVSRPRLVANAFAIAGADLASILTECTDRKIVEYREGREALTGETPDQLAEALRTHFRWKPKEYAPYLDPQRVLMFLAAHDSVVPTQYGHQLRDALGTPELYVAPTGHYTFVLTHLPFHWLGHKLTTFFREHFDLPAP